MDSRKVAVTLANGRSHLVDVPADVAPDEAAAIIRGERTPAEVGWPAGGEDWLAFGNGQGWVRRESIAEIALVDYIPDESAYGPQVYD